MEETESNSSSVYFDLSTPHVSPFNSSFPQVAPESCEKSARLYSSLVDLLQTIPSIQTPQQRWQSLIINVSIQIMRLINAPHDLLPSIESLLDSLGDFSSNKFLEAQDRFHSRLFSELAGKVREYKGFSALCLFSAISGRVYSQRLHVNRKARTDEHLKDMAMRVSHIGILHCVFGRS